MSDRYEDIFDKNGLSISEEMKASAGKDTVIIANLALDDKYTKITTYLLCNRHKDIAAGLARITEDARACELIIYYDADSSIKELEADLALTGAADKVRTVSGAASLVLREESALYHAMETGEIRSCPLEKSFATEGCEGKATIIIDAETACQIECGAGNKIIEFSTSGESVWSTVKLGTSAAEAIRMLSIDMQGKKPVLAGGALGEFIPVNELESVKIGYSWKFDSIHVFDSTDCMCDRSRKLFDHIYDLSCGKCVLCREGTAQLKAIFTDITEGRGKKDDCELIGDICSLIEVGAFCQFGKNMAHLALSDIKTNRSEFDAHIRRKMCPAGVCRSFANYVIDPELCTGCGDCCDVCDEDAITGKPGFIYMIDQDMCEKCDKCTKACDSGAVVIQNGHIRVPKHLTRAGHFK